MKNRLAALTLILFAILTLSGCFPTGEKDPNTSSGSFESDIFEYSANNLTVCFETPDIQDDLPVGIKIKEKIFDTEEVLKLLLNGKTIDHVALDTNYWADDGTLLTVSENSLGFRDGKTCHAAKFQIENPINYQVVLLLYNDYIRNEFFKPNAELDGFPSQNAMERAEKYAASFGMTNLGKPEVYAASLETYQKIRNNMGDFFNDSYPLTKDNEVYFLIYSQVYCDIGLANLYQTSVKDSANKDELDNVFSPKVVIGVSRDQVFFFNVEEAYESKYEIISSEALKYDFDYALNELKNYFDRTYFSKRNIIDKAELVYLPMNKTESGYIEFAPAWCFSGYEFDADPSDSSDFTESMVNHYKIVISAENGVMSRYMEG